MTLVREGSALTHISSTPPSGGSTPMFRIGRSGLLELPAARRDVQRLRALERLGDDLRTLRRGLERLEARRSVSTSTRGRSAAAAGSAVAQTRLGATATFATLRSTAEVNATPTSFGLQLPVVTGSTTSQPIVGGVYDGSNGDDTLSFEFRGNAVVGSADANRVRVTLSDGTQIANLNFRFQVPGAPAPLPNGLTLALGAGDVAKGDTFTVQISASVGGAVDPTRAFDGTFDDAPGFDPGVVVAAGAFDVNGATIQVAANDSIDSVLAKIKASAAGVDASFDALVETLVLTQRTGGGAATIAVSNDTSGFLAATKLAGASVVPGSEVAGYLDRIADVASLASVTSGDFFVNGIAIQVDPAVDSVADIVDRINQSAAGAIASFDVDTQRVQIQASVVTDALELAAGSSGLLPALGFAEGTHLATLAGPRDPVTRFERPSEVRHELGKLGRALTDLFRERFSGLGAAELSELRDDLRNALAEVFDDLAGKTGSALRTGLGIDALLPAKGGLVFQFKGARFERALARDFESVRDFVFGPAETASSDAAEGRARGLVPALLSAVSDLQTRVSIELGADSELGNLVDLTT